MTAGPSGCVRACTLSTFGRDRCSERSRRSSARFRGEIRRHSPAGTALPTGELPRRRRPIEGANRSRPIMEARRTAGRRLRGAGSSAATLHWHSLARPAFLRMALNLPCNRESGIAALERLGPLTTVRCLTSRYRAYREGGSRPSRRPLLHLVRRHSGPSKGWAARADPANRRTASTIRRRCIRARSNCFHGTTAAPTDRKEAFNSTTGLPGIVCSDGLAGFFNLSRKADIQIDLNPLRRTSRFLSEYRRAGRYPGTRMASDAWKMLRLWMTGTPGFRHPGRAGCTTADRRRSKLFDKSAAVIARSIELEANMARPPTGDAGGTTCCTYRPVLNLRLGGSGNRWRSGKVQNDNRGKSSSPPMRMSGCRPAGCVS